MAVLLGLQGAVDADEGAEGSLGAVVPLHADGDLLAGRHAALQPANAVQLAAREAAMASRLRRYLWWSLVVLLALVVTFGLIVFGGVTLRGQS